jgi:intracellular septation protein
MQALFDLVPLAAFLLAYWIVGIYAATGALMVGMLLLLLIDWLRLRRIPPLHLISALLVLLLGGATLILRDTRFLKWKPTIFLWLISFGAALSLWIGKAPLAQRLVQPLIGNSQPLPRATWVKLNWLWVLFYALLGGANLVVAQLLSERIWVDFKVFGITAALVLFAVAQSAWLAARIESASPSTS